MHIVYYVYAYIEFPCIHPPGILSGKLLQTKLKAKARTTANFWPYA